MNETTGTAREGGLWAMLFGVWVAPPWARWLGARLARGASRVAGLVRARPRTSLGGLIAVVLLALGGWFGWVWWQAQPKPVEVSLKVNGPALTDFANNGAPQPVTLVFSICQAMGPPNARPTT